MRACEHSGARSRGGCGLRRFPAGRMAPGTVLGAVVLAACLVSWCAPAEESFRARLEKANATLRKGDAEGALAHYRALQTEDPESELLYYNIGCAQYRKGMQEADAEAPQDALLSFGEAGDAFEKVQNAGDARIRTNAAYNIANCAAQTAKQSMAAQKYEEAVTAFEESVGLYEDFLRKHPDHEGARNNLNHVRYLLKQMLQNPPPPQEQQQQQGGENQDKDSEKQDQQQQQQQEEQQQQAEQQPEQEDQEDQQAGDEQQESPPAEAASAQEAPEEEQAAENPEPEEQQNIDAILESLEDVDEQEQRQTRNQRSAIRVKRDWW